VKIRREPLAHGQGVGFNRLETGGRVMTFSDRFMQLSAEADTAQFQATVLAVICVVAAFAAPTATTNEMEIQYGQGLTWATAKIWWRRFFTIYFLPSVFFTELLLQIFTRTKLFEWLAVFAENNSEINQQHLDFNLESVRDIYLSFALLTSLLFPWITCSWRMRRVKPEPLPPKTSKETIDMRKWAQDESGQYFRVTYRNGEDVLYDTSQPYEQRAAAWIRNKRYTKKWGLILFLAAACLIIFYPMMDNGKKPDDFGGLFARLMVFAAAPLAFVSFLNWLIGASTQAQGQANFVGPAASSAGGRGVEQVEKQKVYGTGGFATREEIHQAAHGKTVGHADETVGHADDLEFDD